MKNRILYITLILLSLQSVASAQSFWRPVAPVPPRIPAYFTSVAGNKAYFWCEAGQVFSTDDGGNSFAFYPWYAPFENVGIGDFASRGISFADTLTGYIADIARGEFRTTDGGHHWQKVSPENVQTNIWLVGFANSKVGFKVGGGFYKTTDAGLTWKFLPADSIYNGFISNMYVLDETKLWVLKGNLYETNNGASIWYCSDGTSKWSRLNTGIESDSLNGVLYTDFHMNPSGVGYATGRIHRIQQRKTYGIILRTTDFGKTWSTQEFPDENYRKLEVINDSTCIVFGNEYSTYYQKTCYRRTGNMGLSWETGKDFESSFNNSFYTSAYIPAKNTILVSTTAGMYRSTDSGLSFSKLSSNCDVYAGEVSFDNRPQSTETQLAAAVSFTYSGNNFIVSRDGGRTWTLKLFPKDFLLDFSHLSISGNCMYLTVGQNSLHKSTDYGDTWQMISPRRYGAISNVYALSPDSVIVQAYPNLCITVDGGHSWKYAPLTNIFLNDIKMYSGLKVWGTGGLDRQNSRAGIIYSSSDGGNNWRVQDIASEELTHVEFIDELTGFAIGGRKLYATRDGGNYWKIINTDAVAFTFYDKYRGVILTESSSLITSDAGLTWNKGNFNFNSLEAKLFFNKRGDLFASSRATLYIYPDALSQIPLIQKKYAPVENTFKIYPNHPNPFNPATTIRYEIPSKMHVELKVYDMLGREVSKLVDCEQPQGEYRVLFDGSSLPSGVYIYTIQAGKYKESKKLMLIK
ncbi:MAG: T9SS type A sorting domain-containing protein [Acidobacteriota bacterium]